MKMLRFPSARWSAHLLLGSVFPWRAVALGVGGYFLLSTAAFPQGSLTPPGAPSPTMKRLDEVEPRTNLQATPPPAGVDTSNANYHYIINQPGSYYLSANLGVSKANRIQINAEDVILDLNGFEISRSSGTGGNGIEIPATSHRVSVRNGSIKGFGFGIQALFASTYARGCAFRDLGVSGCLTYGILAGESAVLEACRAHGNSGIGMFAGAGSTLANCTASQNAGFTGISVGSGCTLNNCSAYANTGTNGIFAGSGSTLTNCSASFNTSPSATSAGFSLGSGCTISRCSSQNNTSTAAVPTATTGMGFAVGDDSMIEGCTANTNKGDGINIGNDTVARDNACTRNGTQLGGNAAGVHATGADNRIEGNYVSLNTRGIEIGGSANLITKNTARANPTAGGSGNYVIAAGNSIAPIVLAAVTNSAIAGNNSPGTLNDASGGNHPWANFSY